jgi:hypothetical protein
MCVLGYCGFSGIFWWQSFHKTQSRGQRRGYMHSDVDVPVCFIFLLHLLCTADGEKLTFADEDVADGQLNMGKKPLLNVVDFNWVFMVSHLNNLLCLFVCGSLCIGDIVEYSDVGFDPKSKKRQAKQIRFTQTQVVTVPEYNFRIPCVYCRSGL